MSTTEKCKREASGDLITVTKAQKEPLQMATFLVHCSTCRHGLLHSPLSSETVVEPMRHWLDG